MRGLWTLLLLQVLACLGRQACGSEIVNGDFAPKGSMLYMASVQSQGSHICGGFLISKDYVLTAAHCDDGKPTRVVLGTHNLKKVADGNIRHIGEKHKHQGYNHKNFDNDIMLLKLSSSAQLGKNVQTIRLRSTETRANEECSVAGWGKLGPGGGPVDDLMVVTVSVISQEVCKEEWKSSPPSVHVICAGGYGTMKGFCQGDSGGPLVCNGTAVGVVSYNNLRNDCIYPDIPNVYTDISKYIPWIDSILNGARRNE